VANFPFKHQSNSKALPTTLPAPLLDSAADHLALEAATGSMSASAAGLTVAAWEQHGYRAWQTKFHSLKQLSS
jgi:hypothetical protein